MIHSHNAPDSKVHRANMPPPDRQPTGNRQAWYWLGVSRLFHHEDWWVEKSGFEPSKQIQFIIMFSNMEMKRMSYVCSKIPINGFSIDWFHVQISWFTLVFWRICAKKLLQPGFCNWIMHCFYHGSDIFGLSSYWIWMSVTFVFT